MTKGSMYMLQNLAMTFSSICKITEKKLRKEKYDKHELIRLYRDMPIIISKLINMQKSDELFETLQESSDQQHCQWHYDKGYREGYMDGRNEGKKLALAEMEELCVESKKSKGSCLIQREGRKIYGG
jgi:flagellar biosynthesis/type III secretory pathway protein FliH